jgi:hypothetical protein
MRTTSRFHSEREAVSESAGLGLFGGRVAFLLPVFFSVFAWEAPMVTLVGQVLDFIQDKSGNTSGLHMEGGQQVHFPDSQGNLVSLIVGVGSRVSIEGAFRCGGSRGDCLEPTLITNLDSNRSMSFLAPKRQDPPGMLLDRHHDDAASRAQLGTEGESVPFGNEAAATTIGRAYDHLHRVQAILAYLHILKLQVPGIGQFLDEAKHTYEQSLSRYQARDFVAALEFASASTSLSRVVEIVMNRALRSDTSLPSLVPPPPDIPPPRSEPSFIEDNLGVTRSTLRRIHWVLQNGTLPLEDRTQVRKIASWGDSLYRQARQMYHQAALPDAAELAQAALAGARSAEHVCRKWYSGAGSFGP